MAFKNPEARKQYLAEYYKKNKERLDAYKLDYAKNVTRKHKKHFGVYVDRDIMEELEKRLIKDNITKTEFINKAILEYLKED